MHPDDAGRVSGEAGVIWTGSDDGKVQVTLDGGATWLDRTAGVAKAGGPEVFWVSRVFPSPHDAGTGFVSKTGWRFDDYRAVCSRRLISVRPGSRSAAASPTGTPSTSIVQDRKNPESLVCGNGMGRLCDTGRRPDLAPDQGQHAFGQGHRPDHPPARERPGRGDLRPRRLGRGHLGVAGDEAALAEDVHLFDIEPRTQRVTTALGNYQLLGDSHLFTPNEPNAVVINYYLKAKAEGGSRSPLPTHRAPCWPS